MQRSLLKVLGLCLAAGSWLFATPALADRASINATAVRIMVLEDSYGGCMVRLSTNPQTVLPACAASWVTLSCDGTFLPKDVSSRLLEQVQLGFALDKQLTVYIDDARRHNGFCLAYRVDVW